MTWGVVAVKVIRCAAAASLGDSCFIEFALIAVSCHLSLGAYVAPASLRLNNVLYVCGLCFSWMERPLTKRGQSLPRQLRQNFDGLPMAFMGQGFTHG